MIESILHNGVKGVEKIMDGVYAATDEWEKEDRDAFIHKYRKNTEMLIEQTQNVIVEEMSKLGKPGQSPNQERIKAEIQKMSDYAESLLKEINGNKDANIK